MRYEFDTSQGIWRVTWGDQHFYSVGLRRARAHARAVFPAGAVGEIIHVDNVLDGLLRQLRESPTASNLHADVRNYVTTQELPLGVDDLSCLLEIDPEDVRNPLTHVRSQEESPSTIEPPEPQ